MGGGAPGPLELPTYAGDKVLSRLPPICTQPGYTGTLDINYDPTLVLGG